MRSGAEEYKQYDRVQWTDDDGHARMGYVMANLSVQYLIRPEITSNIGECFVFKSNPTLKRSK